MIVLTIYSASQLIGIDKTFGNLTDVTSKRQTYLANMLEIFYQLEINNISTASLINDDEISQSLAVMSRGDYDEKCLLLESYLRDYRGFLLADMNLTGEELYFRLNFMDHIEALFTGKYEHCYYIILDGVENRDRARVCEGLVEAQAAANLIAGELQYVRETLLVHASDEAMAISAYSRRIVITQFLVAAGIIIFSILVSIFMARKIERPIRRLAAGVKEIAGGDLNYPIRSGAKDELGLLSNFIGDMVESLKRTNQAKSDFLANMSHEMRTPLNVVVGLTDLRMEDRNLSGEIQEDLKKINSAGELLLGIVNDLLDISKIEAGKFELTRVEYNVASLLNDIITLNMIRIESKPIKFKISIGENFPNELYGDELRVKQIYNNLLGNAFKYTKEGTVTLSVNSKRSGGDIFIFVTVSDTGIGIRPGDIKKLFSDYNQVDTRANRKIEGTGLGLSITKKLVEMMDGEITVESEYGKGSSFCAKIRQGYVNEKVLSGDIVESLCNFKYTDERQHVSSKIVRPDLSYARVLVVDDYQTNLDVAAGMLRKYKMHVDCVTSGKAAIELIRKGEPVYNAVFMDHMMPEMDGVEATELIRGLDSEYAKHVPIISLTANALAGNEQFFLDKGFNAFLSKPINILMLDSVVKKWVRNKAHEAKTECRSPDPGTEGKVEGSSFSIPGVDVGKGLELYDGDMELFMFALGSFIANTPSAIESMRNVTKENLPVYAISVHGLKSACAAIGAEEIRERARKLEALAKAGDLPGVQAENDDLLRDTDVLIANVQKARASSPV